MQKTSILPLWVFFFFGLNYPHPSGTFGSSFPPSLPLDILMTIHEMGMPNFWNHCSDLTPNQGDGKINFVTVSSKISTHALRRTHSPKYMPQPLGINSQKLAHPPPPPTTPTPLVGEPAHYSHYFKFLQSLISPVSKNRSALYFLPK